MDSQQQKLVHRLIAASLSIHAYTKVTTVMALENVLDLMEGFGGPFRRDPNLYYVSIFGSPEEAVWAWQFEGHHVSLNVTVSGREVLSNTPMFLGSNPAEVSHEGRTVIRVLGEEQDAGIELLHALDDKQRDLAIIADVAPPDFVLMNAPRVPHFARPGEMGGPEPTMRAFETYPEDQRERVAFHRTKPKGISWADLGPTQRQRFQSLLDVYIDRLPGDLARLQRARLQAAGLERLHFAWAGEISPGRPQYYRVQGPELLIEYDNTQNDANHVHAVWRDLASDFGGDSLRDHIRRSHKID